MVISLFSTVEKEGQFIGWWNMLGSLIGLLLYVIWFITLCSDITDSSEARACSNLKGTVGTIFLVVLGVLCPLIAYFGWKCVQGSDAVRNNFCYLKLLTHRL
ncbi:hypothetical protein Bhyg_14123 [Pseudolycoriella hygida]|uniref:Uncharacterized protein n=1 Tax=Pseudolycoriella hygida TaxID=35572 RepID=A0A9Q0MPC8_9DIPT|nr:hypothetical protein Bhyg_14123 [Pseudolycoriella hygida]